MPDKSAKFRDPSLPIDQRVEDLVSQLTLEEKVSQLLHESVSVDRLGIPAYNWWGECLHGAARSGKAAVFPQAIGLAATFDVELIERTASAISDEVRARYNLAQEQGIVKQYRGLTCWTPNINIFRDPRWGRGMETYGEDPYLTGEIGAAFVRGLQGDDEKYMKVAACAKHYAVHSGPEALRHEFNAVVTSRDLNGTYLPAFKRLVDEGVEAVMGAYNRTNDEPCCGSQMLLQGMLRGVWGFQGHVVSDCWAVRDFHENHRVTKDAEESAALALKMGCDLNCGCVYEKAMGAIERGLLTEDDINVNLRRLIRTRIKLGMFDPPEDVPFKQGEEVLDCYDHRELAYETAVKSMVVLKNRDGILPLKKDIKSFYITGPNAANVEALLSNYYGGCGRLVTPLEAIYDKAPVYSTIEYKKGCEIAHPKLNPTDWVTGDARWYDVVIACMGIDNTIEGEEGDAISSPHKGDRNDIGLPQHQLEFVRRLAQHGTPVIVVIMSGSPICEPELHELAAAVIYAWYPGEEGGNALADILFGNRAPSGKLPLTFPMSIKDLPAYEDYNMKNRTYRFAEKEPLYPFGFGLIWEKISYSGIKVDKTEIKKGDTVNLSVTVKNEGNVSAEDVVQLYVSAKDADFDVPFHELKAFQRVELKAGEEKELSCAVTPDKLEMVNADGEFVICDGAYEFSIGSSSPGKRAQELGAPEMQSIIVTVKG